jgi:hypothetical protein
MTRQATVDRKHRVQILLATPALDRLNKLVVDTESESYAEVVKNALRLYEAVVNETMNGATFYLERDGARTPVLTMR